MKTVIYNDLGLTPYRQVLVEQKKVFDGLVEGKTKGSSLENADVCPTLILCQHRHVYTLGKSGQEGNMLITPEFLERIGAEYYHTDRGGDITYHGPGQLVGYPILDLDELGLGLKDYVCALEQTVIDTIARFGIEGRRSDGATGVWLETDPRGGLRKISAIGVRSSRYVTMHGFSLNVDPRMEYFSYINPCGFTDRGVTSMAAELECEVDMEEVKKVYAENFEKVFGVRLIEAGTEQGGL